MVPLTQTKQERGALATLDRWRPFLESPRTITFPHMELIGRDFEPPLVVGSGEVRIPTLNRFEYTLRGLPQDLGHTLQSLRYQQENPYDGLARFRLTGTDSEGVEWSLGWTVPRVDAGKDSWTLTGRLDGLLPHDDSATVADESSTELIFSVPVHHPMALSLNRYIRTAQQSGPLLREHVVEALGSTIRFAYDPAGGTLSVTATHSADLRPTYTENWLAEPLMILFGQLIFPRLVARNLGDRRTHVFVRRSPHLIQEAGWVALWSGDNLSLSETEFWNRYTELLTLIARARNENGHPNFEANTVTTFYQEIIQAAEGTRWVWALTLASCIEGLVNLIEPPGQPRPDTQQAAVQSLVDHVRAWPGEDGRLKENAVNAVRRAAQTTAAFTMRRLVAEGAITQRHVTAWNAVRNRAVHGTPLTPYSSEEGDGQLLALVEMMHSLTLAILRRHQVEV